MDFQVGDKVIHWNYGLGEVVQIEQKTVHGHKTDCYVVQTRELTLWVPVEEVGRSSLRSPTRGSEFTNIFAILTGPNGQLPDNRLERKSYLLEQLKDGQLESICRVVRDLSAYSRGKKLNEQDRFILEHAKNFLIAEWSFSMSIPLYQAQQKIGELLSN